ncbi:MAG: response regulator transcription factor [Elusimicrobiota bacterium]
MKRILVVDDDQLMVDFVRTCLTDAKYEVDAAYGGKQGCEKARGTKPDLVVLDLLMPDMHGFDVCQALKKDQSLKDVKILISSAKGYAVDKKAALRMGADGFLTKPYSPEQLLNAVKDLVGEP